MKSIDFLTTQELLDSSIPFAPEPHDRMSFVDDLACEYTDEQLDDVDDLVKAVASQAVIRLLQWLCEPSTDKQIIARLICTQKLLNNRHGEWQNLQSQHDITPKTIRAERDRIAAQTGLKIR